MFGHTVTLADPLRPSPGIIGAVADRLDVVAVRVADERPVVRLVVLGPHPRRVQHLGAGLDGRLVEGVDRRAVRRGERDVRLARLPLGAGRAQPEGGRRAAVADDLAEVEDPPARPAEPGRRRRRPLPRQGPASESKCDRTSPQSSTRQPACQPLPAARPQLVRSGRNPSCLPVRLDRPPRANRPRAHPSGRSPNVVKAVRRGSRKRSSPGHGVEDHRTAVRRQPQIRGAHTVLCRSAFCTWTAPVTDLSITTRYRSST